MRNFALLLKAILFSLNIYAQSEVERYYLANKGDSFPSIAVGSVSEGGLKNAKLMPFNGDNFFYYNESSYLQGRAYTHSKVKNALLSTYAELNKLYPKRKFGIMECSNKEGGKIWPHRTHQNGLSVDFMVPLQQKGKPYYGLDDASSPHSHYLLKFDNKGRYSKDTTVHIDFNLLAHHILLLNKQAKLSGLKITKIIFKIELKGILFKTTYGQQLKKTGIYFAQVLPNYINNVHDDHYHIDFSE